MPVETGGLAFASVDTIIIRALNGCPSSFTIALLV